MFLPHSERDADRVRCRAVLCCASASALVVDPAKLVSEYGSLELNKQWESGCLAQYDSGNRASRGGISRVSRAEPVRVNKDSTRRRAAAEEQSTKNSSRATSDQQRRPHTDATTISLSASLHTTGTIRSSQLSHSGSLVRLEHSPCSSFV